MGAMLEGEWLSETDYADRGTGEFVRWASRFRGWVRADGSTPHPPEAGRYHLYVAPACPWSHRTMIMRVLKGLEDVVSLGTLAPAMLEQGWSFARPDPLTGARHLYEIYRRADPRYSGRVTVPVLWDRRLETIVSNESADIMRMLNREFDAFARERTDYYPPELAAEIDAINARIYPSVNNGVYRAGFATRQEPYEAAVRALFESLDWLEASLSRQRYLAGERLTEADWRLFPTLVRFDAVYYGHFKCNLRHVYEYPALWAYTRELYQMPGIARTVDLEEYKAHYYGSHRGINPAGIIPLGPVLDFSAPHARA